MSLTTGIDGAALLIDVVARRPPWRTPDAGDRMRPASMSGGVWRHPELYPHRAWPSLPMKHFAGRPSPVVAVAPTGAQYCPN